MPDDLIKVFAEVLDCDPASLSDDSSPDNTKGWDSVAAMSLVAAVEETFGVELSTREIIAMRTIGLARQVLRRKGVENV